MENQYFTPTNPICVWVQRILPLVYDDSLSYYEVLAKVVEKINILINNNNNIPAYVKQVFNEFVQSGELEKLVKQILDRQDIVVNVKYPPDGVVAAMGDGATNDSAAFNSCIAYAIKNGMPVYIPDGVYMLDAITINGNVQIFGTPKTNLYLNVKPEAGAMFTIDGGNVGFFNLTAYGQHSKQPNDTTFLYVNEQNANVEVRNVTVSQFNRGFELLDTKSFKADSCIFVNNGMNAITTSNNAYKVTIDNCRFDGLTERNATTYVISNSNGLRMMNTEFTGNASIGINYVGSKDVFIHYYKTAIATPVTGTGLNPIIIENDGKIKYALDDDITAYIANLILNTSGDMTLETHDMTVNAERLIETISGEKASQAAKRTDVVSGTATLEAGAVEVQITQSEKHEVAGQFNVHAGSYKMLDVVRTTPIGEFNVADEAPFIDNEGNSRALLVKGEIDVNEAYQQANIALENNIFEIEQLKQADIALDEKITKLNDALIAPENVNVANATIIVKTSEQIGQANGVIEIPVSIPVSGNVHTMAFVSISGSIKFGGVTAFKNYIGNINLTQVWNGSKIQVGGGSFTCMTNAYYNLVQDESLGYFTVCGFIKMSSKTGYETATLEFTDVDGENSFWSATAHYDGDVTISIKNVVKMPLPYTT